MQLDVDPTVCLPGRVLIVHGLASVVQDETGQAVSLRHAPAAEVARAPNSGTWWRPATASGSGPTEQGEGFIERVEPRHGVLCRTSRGRQQVIVANVDQMLIVGSAAEPTAQAAPDRPHAGHRREGPHPPRHLHQQDRPGGPGDLQPLIGVYGQMGYQVLVLSATTGFGVERLRRVLANQQSVVAGQSGVGKSSLLNAIEPQICSCACAR